jgi:hypothetical protein
VNLNFGKFLEQGSHHQANWRWPPSTDVNGILVFTPSSNIYLSAQQFYWVAVQPVSGELDWAFTDNGASVAYSFDGGLTWPAASRFTDNGAFLMQVNATPTPVPASVLLLGTGRVGLGAMAWRRRKV